MINTLRALKVSTCKNSWISRKMETQFKTDVRNKNVTNEECLHQTGYDQGKNK